jgi:hypothetical protein
MPHLIRVLTYADLGELVFRDEWGLQPPWQCTAPASDRPAPPNDTAPPAAAHSDAAEQQARAIADLTQRIRAAHRSPTHRQAG